MFDETLSVNNADVRSLMAWWTDVGVDQMIDEIPTPWLDRALKKPEPQAKASQTTEIRSRRPDRTPKSEMPRDLAAFAAWLLTLPTLDPICPVSQRIVASGDPASDLMILIDMPDPIDHEIGQLLSGESRNLFDRMLQAIGRDRDSIYIASICPGRPPSGILSEETLIELAPLARQHIALAAPKRLWLMGQSASRAALGVDDAGIRGRLGNFNHEGVNVTAVASFSPRFLLANPKRKAAAWADMRMLIKGIDA